MAGAAAGRGDKRAQSGRSYTWLQGLICGGLVTFAPAFALLFAVLLAPSLLAMVMDGRDRRPIARAVFLANVAFVLAPTWHLFNGEQTLAGALDLLADPAAIGPAWLAAACGWALCILLPVMLRAMSDSHAAARIVALQAEQKEIREAWDLDAD